MIEVVNRQRLVRVDAGRVKELAGRALGVVAASQGASPDLTVTIAFVRDPAIRKLNRDYRAKDRETDVLSFPAGDEGRSGDNGEETGYLGDIVISVDTAVRQAKESGLEIEREVQELVLHGVLHLCGYDHEVDRGEMNRLELRLRRRLLDGAGAAARRRRSS